MSPNVAFCRTLKPGMAGDDVVAHKRAISHALPKTYPWYAFTEIYGPAFQTAVKEYQRQHGIPQTGVIGATTHESLEKAKQKNHPELYAFDSLAIKLAKDFCAQYGKTPEQLTREAILACGFYWYQQHRWQIAYSQSRPFWLGHPPSYPARWDCLVEGTGVSTDRGDVPIERVRVGDMVLTRRGYRRVLNAWMVRNDAELYRVDLTNGTTLTGTRNHRVYTENRGWVQLGDLQEADMLLACHYAKSSSSKDAASTATPTTSRKQSAGTSWRRMEHHRRYREPSGALRMAPFPTATTYTTSIGTPKTTTSQTLRPFPSLNIAQKQHIADPYRSTPALVAENDSAPTHQLPPDDLVFAQTHASSVTTGLSALTPSPRHVNDAAASFGRTSIALEPSARVSALTISTPDEELSGTARGVAIFSSRDAQSRASAHGYAQIVTAARKVGVGRVYDLTVAGEHEFYANGVLVHNCSGFVTACHYAGGAPDPNGRGYDGLGYTGTLKNHGERVATVDDLKPADLIFYGYSSGKPGFNSGDPTHVALYVGNRMVLSMGSYPMKFYAFNYRSDINQYRSYPITGGAL